MEVMNVFKEFGLLGVTILALYMIYSDMNKQQKAREEKYLEMINGSLKDIMESLQNLLRSDKNEC